MNKKFNMGHLCNRKLFHATESAISLAYYSNVDKIENLVKYTSDLGNRIVKRIKTK
jgi:hypothetical protein